MREEQKNNISFLSVFRAFLARISCPYFSADVEQHACVCAPLSVSSALLPSLLHDEHLVFAASCRWVVSDTHTVQLSVAGAQVIVCLLINQQLH